MFERHEGIYDYLTAEAAARIETVHLDPRADTFSHAIPMETIVEALESIVEPTTYDYLPESIYQVLEEVAEKFGSVGLGFYKKLLITRLIYNLPNKLAAMNLPEKIIELYPDMLDYVTDTLANTPDDEYLADSSLIRDLRLTSARSIPCGARIVDNFTFAPKSICRNNGLLKNLSALWFFYFNVGGLKPLYRTHTEVRYLKYFNKDGVVKCYLNIADLMRRNPHIRGVISTSWFYDPQLEAISPRLAYLRRIQQENGAYVRYDGPGEIHTQRAIATSKTRRDLYEAGKYIPTCYTLIWSRKDLLRWADQQSHD